jgi:hypothetical protein
LTLEGPLVQRFNVLQEMLKRPSRVSDFAMRQRVKQKRIIRIRAMADMNGASGGE